jgi:L-ascorbate metabolism protein UlaG (beta-lactamase superfamily)
MDFQFFGANCVAVTHKGTRIIIDDNLAELGGKSVLKPTDVALYTAASETINGNVKLVLSHPGEYEVADISIYGIAARSHMDESSKRSATMFKLIAGEISVFFPGHIYPELTDDELESIGIVDIMFIPVGGNGYTLDPVGALKIIRKIEPKLIIPTHYADTALNFEVPQQELAQALNDLAMEPKEYTNKLKVKITDLTDAAQLVVLEKS